ncbi:MAG: choice-of-anchor J domain-containing protein [Ignavibacteria bacterium]
MHQKWFTYFTLFFILSGILLGFSFLKDRNNDNPPTSRTQSNQNSVVNNEKNFQTDMIGFPYRSSGTPYYTDNFDGANDTTSLKSRGYKIYYRGSGPQGPVPTWFQGSLFPSFNGPSTGYVAGVYQVATSVNNIDNWLVLPRKNVSSADSLVFYARSESGSAYSDSIRVMYSAAGDSTPESSWTELGRFKADISGVWERKAFRAGSSGANARFAIRYSVVNSGPEGTNGNYIGIDGLSIESSIITNDISATSVNSPSGALILPASTFAPKATFKNNGTLNQSNIPVTYKITGPVNYTSSKIISSLISGVSSQVIFDSTFNPLPGNYTVTVYSGLASDGNRYNDTVKSSFTSADPNYGNSAGYFYANSTSGASGAPSHPSYCWKDTAGSVTLELNTVNIQPGITTGDLDDGYWKVLIPSGKKVRFFGSNYDTIRIGTNGVIGFQTFIPNQSNWGPPANGIPGGGVLNAIYPLWTDFDFTDNVPTSTSRISYKVSGNYLVITYDRAPVYSGDPGDYVSFQVTLDVSTAPVTNSRILFQYADTTGAKTGAGFISDLNSNNLSRHLIGLQNAAGTSALTYRFRNSSSLVTTGKIFNSPLGNLALQMGPDAAMLNNACFALDLTSRLQAVQLTRRDTLTVSIRQSISPYAIIETKKIVYDSISGSASVPLNLAQNGVSYYIYITHRNSLPTWSSAPVLCTANTITYDFTTALSKAFGNKMILISGKASFYSGDVSRDNCINLTDIIEIYNSANLFTSGSYVLDDLNFDGTVNLTDILVASNNGLNFICESAPSGAMLNSYEPSSVDFNYAKDIMAETKVSKKEWIKKFGK